MPFPARPELIVPIKFGKDRRLLMPSSGLIALVGPSGSGKTSTLEFLGNGLVAEKRSVSLIRFCEPEDGAIFDPHEFLVLLCRALTDPTVDVILLDSFRYFTYAESSGATGKGGINMRIFAQMTGLCALARIAGKLILATHNPLASDEAALRAYIESANGSIDGVINCVAPGTIEYSHRSEAVATSRSPVAYSIPAKLIKRMDVITPSNFLDDDSDDEIESF
jgi:energy-coupling factor transporter ATP-binding protein EcfA2